MILTKNILILEDNLLVVSKLLEKLARIEQNQPYDLCTIQFSDAKQAEEYIKSNLSTTFDIILLDRDDKRNGSFHILDLNKLGPENIISISSVPEWNEEAKKRGIKKIIEKDLLRIDDFAEKVAREIEKMLYKMTLPLA